MANRKLAVILAISAVIAVVPASGYGGRAADVKAAYSPAYASGSADIAAPSLKAPFSQEYSGIFTLPDAASAGENVVSNNIAEINLSNTKDGYLTARYLAKTGKAIKVIIKTPEGKPYVYGLRADGKCETFPISEGSGHYQVTVYENVSGNKYFSVLKAAQDIQLTDEFAPFIRPNQYVNYTSGGKTAQKAAELTKDAKNTTDRIAAIYSYVIKNISYDQQLAGTVQSGYTPDADKILESGKGICFDYASVLAAMLRSQGIPAKLVVGYRGKDYHAWISTYSNEAGWLNGKVYFDGQNWKTLDPTLDSCCGKNDGSLRYIGDENYYFPKYFY